MSYFIFDTEAKAKAYGDAGPYPITGTKGPTPRGRYPAVLTDTTCWDEPRKNRVLAEWCILKQPVANSVADPVDSLREDTDSIVETDANWFRQGNPP